LIGNLDATHRRLSTKDLGERECEAMEAVLVLSLSSDGALIDQMHKECAQDGGCTTTPGPGVGKQATHHPSAMLRVFLGTLAELLGPGSWTMPEDARRGEAIAGRIQRYGINVLVAFGVLTLSRNSN
jgi:hypothetical protein